MSLHQLPESTVCRISSSQVITSMTSVVKELVENAVDAGATCIEVKLENYGLDKIEVRDNGTGLKPDDVELAAKKHYTSKLRCFDDLNNLSTYGFRGEALASLCAVSDVSITTKSAEVNVGATYSFDCNGNVTSCKPSHLPQGTTVCVSDLFKTLPVRRSYYGTAKRCREELRHIDDCLVAFAVIRFNTRFTFRHNTNLQWTKVATSDVQHALISVVGSNVVSAMKHIQRCLQEPLVEIDAFLPLPGVEGLTASKSNNDRLFTCVNRRPVVMPEITKLLRSYYNHALPSSDTSRFPIAFLQLTVPPSELDVNVEPNKQRVLLHRQDVVIKFIEDIFIEIYGPLPSSTVDSTTQTVDKNWSEKNSVPDCELLMAYDCMAGLISDEGIPLVNDNPSTSHRATSEEPNDVGDVLVCPPPQVAVGASAAEWSKGQLLSDVDGCMIEPVKLLTSAPAGSSEPLRTPVSSPMSSTAVSNSEKQQLRIDNVFSSQFFSSSNDQNHDANHEESTSKKESKLLTKRKTASDSGTEKDKQAKKKIKHENNNNSDKGMLTMCLEKLFSSQLAAAQNNTQSPGAAKTVHSVSVPFSIPLLTKQLAKAQDNTRLPSDRLHDGGRLHLIGRLRSHGMWVCLRDQYEVVLFHLVRAQEQLLYARMMANHVLPVLSLESPICLDAQKLYSTDRRNLLMSLSKSKSTVLDRYCYYTDERLVANGFKIREHRVGIAKCIRYYDLSDLNEVLSCLELDCDCKLANCRSVKLKHFFQSEAVRLARQLSPDVTAAEVVDLLAELHQSIPLTVTNCFHNRPFIIPICKVTPSDE